MPLYLVLLPQFLRIRHTSPDSQFPRAHDFPNLHGFMSPCHHQAVTQPLSLMEEPANIRSNGVYTSQNSSLSSLDYSDLTLSLPAMEAGSREDRGSFGSPTPTSQDQRYGRDVEDMSQWQCEFRGQIRALRQWLRSMEMRLPPLDPRLPG